MDSCLDVKLKHRMQSYLQSFFQSLQGDMATIQSFASSLSSFQSTIWTHHDELQTDTLLAVRGFASIINTVTSSVLELEMGSEEIHREATAEISRVLSGKMAQLTIDDEKDQHRSAGSHLPPYIRASYNWLLSNLHNPYPTKDTKRNIAQRTKSSVKDIDSWFVDARKRIGWNALRRQRFSNKQEGIITAATKFFKPAHVNFTDDLTSTLESERDTNDAYNAEFIAMENAARTMYSGALWELPSSNMSLNRRQRPRIPSMTSTKDGSKRKRTPTSEPANLIAAHDPSNEDPAHSYPTPEPSPGQSSNLLLSPSIFPPSDVQDSQSQKRQRSSVDFSDGESYVEDGRVKSSKRSRSCNWAPADADSVEFSDDLPSSASLVQLSNDVLQGNILSNSQECATPVAFPNCLPKRKRRLSDGDGHRPAKRPHQAVALQRLHAVSDPFPFARPFEDDTYEKWFNDQFASEHALNSGIPSPLPLDVQEYTLAPLDVHAHTYDVSPNEIIDSTFPETPIFAHVNAANDYWLPETATAPLDLEKPTKATSQQGPLIHDPSPGAETLDLFGTDDFPLSQGLNLPSVIAGTDSQELSLNSLDPSSNSTTSPLENSDWRPLPNGESVQLTEPSSSSLADIPPFSDFDSILRDGPVASEDRDFKRLRLQFLREELRILESELCF